MSNYPNQGSCEEEPPKGFYCVRDFHHNGPCTLLPVPKPAEAAKPVEAALPEITVELTFNGILAGRPIFVINAPADLPPGTYNATLVVKA